MRDLDYDSTLQKLFTPGIVATLTQIHEGKGILPIASVTGHDTLEKLNEIAKTRDAGASCRLEGIKVTEKHLRELLDGKERARGGRFYLSDATRTRMPVTWVITSGA